MSVLSMRKQETPSPESVNRARTLARPPKVRRRPLVLMGAIAAVLIGALAAVWIWTTSATATDVVAAREAVQRGEVIDRADLEVVKVGLDPSLDIVPASRIDQIAGQRAATDLVPGGLLAAGSVTNEVLTGDKLVDVLVPTEKAAELAARAATGRVALVLESRER